MNEIERLEELLNRETELQEKHKIFTDLVIKLFDKGKFHRAYRICTDYNSYCEEKDLKNYQARVLGFLGITSFYLNDEEKAVEYNLKAVEIFYKLNQPLGVADVFNNISGVFYSKKEFNKAIEYMEKAIEIIEKQENKKSLAPIYLNLARVYNQISKIEEAKYNLKKADYWNKDMINKLKIVDNVFIRNYHITFSEINLSQGDTASALNNANIAIEKSIKHESNHHLIIAKRVKATILSKMERFQEAGELLEEIMPLLEKESYDDLSINCLNSLSDFFEKANDYQKSIYYYKKYMELFEVIEQKRRINKTELLESKFDEIINQKEKEFFKKQNIELKNTLEKLNLAYENLNKTHKEKIQAEKLNATLKTVVEMSKKLDDPLEILKESIKAIKNQCPEELFLDSYFDKLCSNLNRIDKVIKQLNQLRKVELKEYVSGVKMIHIDL